MQPNHIQLQPMYKVEKKLNDMGIIFVKEKPDILLLHTYKAKPSFLKEHLDRNIPTILIERVAAAHVLSRENIKKENVVGIAKSTIFRDWRDNNRTLYQGKRHCYFIAKQYGFEKQNPDLLMEHPIPILEEHIPKIELWYNFAVYKMMNYFTKIDMNYKATRGIDINFFGTTRYGHHSSMITYHRRACIDAMRNLKNCNVSMSGSRIAGKKNYVKGLISCKVGVSPWGLGTKCYRDFEAIYAGCILLKPECSFVLDWIDTYNPKNDWYLPCKLDWSDLQEKVDWVKYNWNNLLEKRRERRDRLLAKCNNDEILATHIHNVIKKCSKRIK